MTSSDNNKPASSLRRSMITGSIWMLAMRWSIRGIGLISTIILARLLVPEDFGLVAMGMIVVGLTEAMSAVGADLALIRNPEAERKHYDTAWTFRLLQALFVFMVLILLAPYMADYFNEPRVVIIIRLLAIGALASGFENIGVVAFRKDLNFHREFRFRVMKKFLTFTTTMTCALILQNYWALVIGIISGRILEVVLSYLMHSYRPRFCLQASKELWSFSQWMLVINIGNFANKKLDEFVVGGTSGTANMGTYNIAAEVSTLPTTELVMPLSRSLFPGYSKLVNEPKRLSNAFKNVLGFVLLFTIPAAFGIGVVAQDLVLVLLGQKWLAAIPLIKWLAILGAVNAITSMTYNLFVVRGKERMLAILICLQIIVTAPLLFMASKSAGVEGIAITRAAFSIVFLIISFGLLSSVAYIDIKGILGKVWRPFLSSLVMVAAILTLRQENAGLPILTLLLDVMLGISVFIPTLYLLWYVSGKSQGAEKIVIDYLKNKFVNRADAK